MAGQWSTTIKYWLAIAYPLSVVTVANWRPKRQALAGPSNDGRPENLIARTFREIGALSERFMRGTHAKGKMIFLPLTTRINVGSDRRQGGRFDAEERPVGQARPQRAQDWRQQTLHPAGSDSASSFWRRGNSLLENFPDAREIFLGVGESTEYMPRAGQILPDKCPLALPCPPANGWLRRYEVRQTSGRNAALSLKSVRHTAHEEDRTNATKLLPCNGT